MIVTEREQKLINALIEKDHMTVDDMLLVTKTSKRTLYRDLQSLQGSLKEVDVNLQRDDGGYYLTGNLDALENLHSMQEWKAHERLLAELILLLDGNLNLSDFMERFGSSQPTISNDLSTIEVELAFNDARLRRRKGLVVEASEFSKRSILVGVLAKVLKAIDLFNLTKDSWSKNQVASLIDFDIYQEINQAFDLTELDKFSDKTQFIWRLFFLASMISSIEIEGTSISPSKASLMKTKEITRNIRHSFSPRETAYLANIADILHYEPGTSLLFTEKFDTDFSYKISKFINLMSEEMKIDFERDEKLFDLLNAHLRSTILLPSFFDRSDDVAMIREIEKRNSKMFGVVAKLLNQVFEKKFSKKEIAYITLHFVSTLERSDNVLPLVVALITSNGFVTTEILSGSIKTQFPFIKEINIIQSSQLDKYNLSDFDIIFSTDFLDIKEDYLKVDGILNRKNIQEMSEKLRVVQQSISGRRILRKSTRSFVNLQDFFKISSMLLEDFKIQIIANDGRFSNLIEEIVDSLDEDIVADSKGVQRVIDDRFEKTPFGIPETELVLFHGVHSSILKPHFEIFDLDEEVELLGMDRKNMRAKRVMLLLAPKDSDELVSYLLGKISSSIIENKLYTTIYNSGNYEVIYQLLNQIITESLKEYEA